MQGPVDAGTVQGLAVAEEQGLRGQGHFRVQWQPEQRVWWGRVGVVQGPVVARAQGAGFNR